MIRANVHDLLAEQAAARPDAPALTYRGHTATYAEVWRSARAAAAQLRSIGVRRGDRVAIYLEKRLETVAAFFAASAAGALFVPVNHVLKPLQVGHILADSGATVLITSADRLDQLAAALAGSRGRERHRRGRHGAGGIRRSRRPWLARRAARG